LDQCHAASGSTIAAESGVEPLMVSAVTRLLA
jgi:hypothetical protein